MAFESGVAVEIGYVKEVTRGTTPASPAMKKLRLTQRNINGQANAVRSEEVDSTEQVKDSRQGFRSTVGSFGFELSHMAYNDMIVAAIDGAWAAAGGTPHFTGATQVAKVSNLPPATFTMERRFLTTTQYQPFRGVAINQFGIQVQADQPIVRGTLDLIGMSYGAMTGVSLGAPSAAPSRPPMVAFQGDVIYDGSPVATITGFNFTINNQRQLQAVIGDYYSPEVFKGQKQIAGQLTALLQDASPYYNDFFNENEVSLALQLMDPNGTDFLGMYFPRIKINSAPIEPGATGPILITSDIEILYDATEGTTITFERTGA